jgi:heavy metal sensor kinase
MKRLRPTWFANAISVRTRLTFWNVGILACALLAFGGALRGTVQANLTAGIDRNLAKQAQTHQAMTARWQGSRSGGSGPSFDNHGPPQSDDRLSPNDRPGPPPDGSDQRQSGPHGSGGPPPDFGPVGTLPVRLLNLHEMRLQPWSHSLPWDPDTFPRSVRGQEVYSTVRDGQQHLRVLSVPLSRDGKVIGVAQMAASLTDADREMAHLTRALLMLIPLVLVIAGAGGAWLTGRTLRPVRDVTQAANRIEAEDLSARLTVTGKDEFSELASTFNGMLERLDGAFRKITVAYERERRFTADASHELRTPLAIIKGYTSLMLSDEHSVAEYRRALEATDRAVDRTNRIVQDLLLLARADSGQYTPSLTPLSLRSVLDQALEAIRRPDDPPVYLRVHADPPVRGSQDALVRLFDNLLTNAARHTPATGRITASLETEGETALVTVADTGEGIAPEHLPHLFERFHRADAGRAREDGGTGLGLAICRSIAEAHGGSITVESEPGVGTTFRVTLPLAAIEAAIGSHDIPTSIAKALAPAGVR